MAYSGNTDKKLHFAKFLQNEVSYVSYIGRQFVSGKKYNKRSVESFAKKYGILNKNLVKELTELAIVMQVRRIVDNGQLIDGYARFSEIAELYRNQVNLSHRTSRSMMLQQYSTPAPIAYAASLYVYSGNKSNGIYFEPSAGNGLLTTAIPKNLIYANEIDDIRLRNLHFQGFRVLTRQDATLPFVSYYNKFDGVITNPPFGTLDEAVNYDGYKIKTLDHLMALRALDTMKDCGKAAIIIGGHTKWDSKGRIQSGKNRLFFNYLYSHYNVEDVILIDGHKLYSRQGTAFNTRLILINGRKPQAKGFAPLKKEELAEVLYDFNDLWERIFEKNNDEKRIRILKFKAIAKLKLLKLLEDEGLGGIKSMAFNKDILKYKAKKLSRNKTLMFMPFGVVLNFIPVATVKLKQSVIEKALKKHNLTIDYFINFPEKVGSPLAIFNSEKFVTSKIIVTEALDLKKHKVIVVIATNMNNEINAITSIHGRISRQLKRWERTGLCLYKKKGFEF